MKIIPVRKYLDELLSSWERLHLSYPNENAMSQEEWEKFCHIFNRNLRIEIKLLLSCKDKILHRQELLYGIEILQHIFRLWQLQYKMYNIETGQVTNTTGFEEVKKEYNLMNLLIKDLICKYKTEINHRD